MPVLCGHSGKFPGLAAVAQEGHARPATTEPPPAALAARPGNFPVPDYPRRTMKTVILETLRPGATFHFHPSDTLRTVLSQGANKTFYQTPDGDEFLIAKRSTVYVPTPEYTITLPKDVVNEALTLYRRDPEFFGTVSRSLLAALQDALPTEPQC